MEDTFWKTTLSFTGWENGKCHTSTPTDRSKKAVWNRVSGSQKLMQGQEKQVCRKIADSFQRHARTRQTSRNLESQSSLHGYIQHAGWRTHVRLKKKWPRSKRCHKNAWYRIRFSLKGHCHGGALGTRPKFTHCCPSSSPWISSILGHPTLKPTRMLSFLPGHHEDMFCFFLKFWKNVLERCCSDKQCMSSVERLRRASGFWQFVEHLLRMEQKRQDDLACDKGALVSVWFWLFRWKIRARRRVRGQ